MRWYWLLLIIVVVILVIWGGYTLYLNTNKTNMGTGASVSVGGTTLQGGIKRT